MSLTAACINFSPKKADVAYNLARIGAVTEEAVAAGADLVVFPESATSGYFLEGGVFECALSRAELLDGIAKSLEIDKAVDVCVGFYEKDGEDLFNSCAYLEFGPEGNRVVDVYRKFFLPTYGVFDEERFVSSGREVKVFETRFGQVAMLICEDVWHSILPTLCSVRGASMLLVPSASPGRGFQGEQPENLERYGRLLQAISEEHSIFCLHAMLSGFEGGKGFVGGSSITDPYGACLVRGPVMEEHIAIAEVDLDQVVHARSRSPLFGDLRGAWSDLVRLAEGSL